MILECIPDSRDIETWVKLSETYGLRFEYNEFFRPAVLEDPAAIDGLIRLYKGLGRDTSDDTVHGAFFDITVASSDPLIRNASDYRVKQSIEIAERLGARGVVFHTNYLSDFRSSSYREGWAESNTRYWGDICAAHGSVCIFLENMFDESPELLGKVASNLKDVPNFGVCLDIAHAFLSDVPVADWTETLADHVRHIHINDNDGREDLHLAVGSGSIDWSVLKDERLFRKDPSVLIEVSGKDRLESSLKFLKKSGFLR
ncbi:MAG: sugar phosphate isomerase/epimerase [Lachnospiraceae bacterium]|nr:sugar phosphate isomerase/epimerase [Lachnospiraceae bacterium]